MNARPKTLVVIEFGASWPRWLAPNEDRGDLAVVAQHYAGPPTDLIAQVALRMTRLSSRGWQLSTVVLVSNGRVDVPTAAARAVLARGLLAHLAASGGGSFALSVDNYLGRRAENNLQHLAQALEPVARVNRVQLRLERTVTSSETQPVADALTG
jgi:hypothetical protein